MTKIIVAVYIPETIPESFRVYYQNVINQIDHNQFELIPFTSPDIIPEEFNILWDIRSGGGGTPPNEFLSVNKPLVVTIHGVATMGIPLWDYFKTFKSGVRGLISNIKKKKNWKQFINNNLFVIAVSEFGKQSINDHLNIPLDKIHVCLHGVNHDLFTAQHTAKEKTYFLHISNGEPRKNIHRIIEAYNHWNIENKPTLLLKVPAFIQDKYHHIAGIKFISNRLSDDEIKALYASAIGYLFPSLYEGFGLPILEAMATHCPVITSNSNACVEVAGKAALIVNPHSTRELTAAMHKLWAEHDLRDQLITAGDSRSKEFSWKKSADAHMKVFSTAHNSVQ